MYTHTPTPASSMCPWVWESFIWPLSCFFLSLYFATYNFSCVCVCVRLCACDYSLCYVSCCGPILPPFLPSPALSHFLSLSMCLYHSSSGTLRARRSGWSTWWSRWLVVWRGLAWHGGSQAKGCEPQLPLAIATQKSRPRLNGQFTCLRASCLIQDQPLSYVKHNTFFQSGVSGAQSC